MHPVRTVCCLCLCCAPAGTVGLLPDGVYQRGGTGYSMPGSHPLTTLSSNASSLAGLGSLGGAGAPLQHASSYGGSGSGAANGGSMPSSGTGASYGGAGSYPGSQGGSPTKAGFGSIGGGYGPGSSGPLYKSGSHGSLGGAPGSRGVSSAGGGAAGGSDVGGVQAGGISRGGSGVQLPGAGSWGGSSAGGHPGSTSLGGFNSAPLAGVAGECLLAVASVIAKHSAAVWAGKPPKLPAALAVSSGAFQSSQQRWLSAAARAFMDSRHLALPCPLSSCVQAAAVAAAAP